MKIAAPMLLGSVTESAHSGYLRPSREIEVVVNCAPLATLTLTNSDAYVIHRDKDRYVGIADLARKNLRLAGIHIDCASRTPMSTGWTDTLSASSMASGSLGETVIALPEKHKFADLTPSPNGKHIAILARDETSSTSATRAFLFHTGTGAVTEIVAGYTVNSVLGDNFVWSPDSLMMLVKTVPAGRPVVATDVAGGIPLGPNVESTIPGKKQQNPTYSDLLSSDRDVSLFLHYAESTVVAVSPMSGETSPIPGLPHSVMFDDLSVSADSEYLLYSVIGTPSRKLTVSRWPIKFCLLNLITGESTIIVDRPLQDSIPNKRSTAYSGSRDPVWFPTGHRLLVVDASIGGDGGDPTKEAAVRDEVYSFDAESPKDKRLMFQAKTRIFHTYFDKDTNLVVLENWFLTKTREYTIVPADGGAPKTLFRFNVQDSYGHPGHFVTLPGSRGRQVYQLPDGAYLMSGEGATPVGLRPFLRAARLETNGTVVVSELWRNNPEIDGFLVNFVFVSKSGDFVFKRESADSPPEYLLASLSDGRIEVVRSLLARPHPQPAIRAIEKKLISFPRTLDGTTLSATVLSLPNPSGRSRPCIIWAYPREFNSNAEVQVTTSPHSFMMAGYGSPLIWALMGFVVVDEASMPVVGDPMTANDNFVEQIVNNAESLIDELVTNHGVDRHRIAVGGHSYGAFMAVNLAAHCKPDTFAAVIARSGAYNRSLTPFGFQSEQRTFWEAMDAYSRMSPFNHAHLPGLLRTPVLLIHGEEDKNTGTHYMQSQRMFAAIRGHGGIARFVSLPLEGHGYRALESILHLLHETEHWLNEHVVSHACIENTASCVTAAASADSKM